MKALKNWLLFIVVIGGGYFGWKYINLPFMPSYLILLFSLSLAFTWVEKLKWGSVKPFSCVSCLTGWFSLILAYLFHNPFWYFYLFAGLLVGSLFEALKSKL